MAGSSILVKQFEGIHVINFFRNLEIDRASFWLGFIAGALFLVIVNVMRRFLPGFIKITRQQLEETREKLTASVETRLRNDVVRHAQKQHIASMFFSLDEIALEPRLIAPPPLITHHKILPPVDVVQLTIPYIPDWPELAATYHAPTISLVEALQEQANLIILGHPGSGKTFSLAWLATRIARKDPLVGQLADLVPIYFHASDIPMSEIPSEVELSNNEQLEDQAYAQLVNVDKQSETLPGKIKSPLENLTGIIYKYVSILTQPRLPSFLQTCLTEKHVIFIIDGFDELPPDRLEQAVNFLAQLYSEFPGNRVITAGSFECLDGMIKLGLFPIALAAWGSDKKQKLVSLWSQQWERFILPYFPPASAPVVDRLFLDNWLKAKEMPSNPLELTLKIWASYAGDIVGVDQPSLIESYLRRGTLGFEGARPALEQIASQMIINKTFTSHQQEANQWISGRNNQPAELELAETETKDQPVGTQELPQVHGHISLNTLVNTGIITNLPDSYVRFSHLVFTCYLAGSRIAMLSDTGSLQVQPNWAGKAMALYFLAHFGDASFLAMSLIRHDDFLCNELLRVSRWLRITPKSKAWRSLVLRALASALNKESTPMTLGAKLLTAIALSGDQGVSILFRQLLKSDKVNIRLLAALGCGLVRDSKSISDLSNMIEDHNPNLVRSACLALVEIGEKSALETIASELMHGSETSRRAAAEALANHPTEGHPALEEGSTMGDLMVRRSVVFGLVRIRQTWANQILDKLQMEDEEWIVRNAAIQAIEEINQPNPYIPRPLPPLPDTAWLVEFASKQGLGVTADEQALSLVLRTLKVGTEDERLAALEFLALNGDMEIASSIYEEYFGQTGDLREAAYQALWLLSATGADLPPPQQFGYA